MSDMVWLKDRNVRTDSHLENTLYYRTYTLERRNFLKLPLAISGAALATQALGVQSAFANTPAPTVPVTPVIPRLTGLKGFGYGGKTAADLKKIQSLNLDWYYGWTPKYPTTPLNFIPMIRDDDYTDDAIAHVKRQLVETKATNLLGFNEPDLRSQSNMSVDKVIKLWPKLEETGLRLGSPATIKPNAEWMNKFMKKAKQKGLQIDFVTMHCYQWPDTEDFLRKLDNLHEKWGLPVWVTEYAVADFDATDKRKNKYSRNDVNTYMKETVEGMRERPWVERFAWKTRKVGDNQMSSSIIFHSDGSLTSTGELYASL